MSEIETIESLIVAKLQTISYFSPDAGGTVRGVSDIKTFLDLSTIASPSAIVVFDGEKAKKDETIGRVTQETEFFWSIYLGAASFGSHSEGRLDATGSYQQISDVVTALEGFALDLKPVTTTKLIYLGAARYQVSDTVVIYEARFRHQFLRQGPVGN